MGKYTNEKLEYLLETKRLIREALRAKGQIVSIHDTFRSYADKIMAIKSGGREIRLEYATSILPPDGDRFATTTRSISHDGRYVLYRLENAKRVDIYDIEAKKVVWSIKDESGAIVDALKCDFDNTSTSVVGTRATDDPRVRDIFRASANSFEVITQYSAGEQVYSPQALACAPDADEIYLSYFAFEGMEGIHYIYKYHSMIYSDGEWKIDSLTSTLANGFLFTNDGEYAIAYGDGIQRIVRADGSEYKDPMKLDDTVVSMSLTANDNYVIDFGLEPYIAVHRISDYEKIYDFEGKFDSRMRSICIPGSNIIVSAKADGSDVRMFDVSTGSPVEKDDIPDLSIDSSVDALVGSYMGNRLLFAGPYGYEVWNVIETKT